MVKINHENQNRLDRTKELQSSSGIASAPLLKTLRGVLKSELKKQSQESKPDLREPCSHCGRNVLPKNIVRHNFLCHDLLTCPICKEPHPGQKKLGRHIKKQHGHRAFMKYKMKQKVTRSPD